MKSCIKLVQLTNIPTAMYEVIVTYSEGKRPLGRPRRRWEDNIKMYIHEVKCGSMDWIELARDRDKWRPLVNAVMNFQAP